jgi:N-acetylglutamate synthase-like GNAT family acetyltransferase
VSTELLTTDTAGAARPARPRKPRRATRLTFRRATAADARKLLTLIGAHAAEGHLLARSLDELTSHAARFTLSEDGDRIIGCAELAPLSPRVAEVRSLVVDASARGLGVGRALLVDLERRGSGDGFASLCAFTHDPRFFVRLGFSLVPHAWIPEKISHDCVACPQFRTCGQSAVIRALAEGQRHRADAFVPLASLRS